LIKVQAIKNVENQNNYEIQCRESKKFRESMHINDDGGLEKINTQERIPCWEKNDPTVIINAQESRAFESNSLNTLVMTLDSTPGGLLRH
jgi:hypothetical protein